MSDQHHGVSVNGEPDGFGARYGQMVTASGWAWVVGTAAALLALLLAIAALNRLIFG